MSGFIDFEAVKASVPIAIAVEMLGLTLKENNGQLRGECPVCQGGPRILAVTPSKDKFYCFGCKTGGDQIALVAHIRGEHPKDAAHFLAGPQPDGEKASKPTEPGALRELDYLVYEHEAVEALGIEPHVAEAIGCGYAKRGVMRGTVAWPVRLADGTLVAYIGLTEIAKLPPNFKL